MTEPRQKPGLSRQDYATPRAFLDAFERTWGKIHVDLAADETNHVVDTWIGPGSRIDVDSLAFDWGKFPEFVGYLWLNPPFGDIAPWAAKCAAYRGPNMIAMLTPASVGSNWFADYVWPRAHVVALQGRLSFDGKAPFPKDCMLSIFGPHGIRARKFGVWNWRVDARKLGVPVSTVRA